MVFGDFSIVTDLKILFPNITFVFLFVFGLTVYIY
jgi:hypothetical protein